MHGRGVEMVAHLQQAHITIMIIIASLSWQLELSGTDWWQWAMLYILLIAIVVVVVAAVAVATNTTANTSAINTKNPKRMHTSYCE